MASKSTYTLCDLVLANKLEELKSKPEEWIKDKFLERQNGKTALMFACEENFTEVASYLIACDEFLDSMVHDESDFDGWTALHFACRNQNLELVKRLLEKGASVIPEVHGTKL